MFVIKGTSECPLDSANWIKKSPNGMDNGRDNKIPQPDFQNLSIQLQLDNWGY
jgi:hypothetical protein